MAQKKSPPPRVPFFVSEETWELHPMWSQFFENLITAGFVDRGDPAALDFDKTDLTIDAKWNPLDLSSIVPVGAKAVLMILYLGNTAAGHRFQMRKNGNSNANVRTSGLTQVGGVVIELDVIVTCDVNRVIEYHGSTGGTWNSIDIVIKGWWL